LIASGLAEIAASSGFMARRLHSPRPATLLPLRDHRHFFSSAMSAPVLWQSMTWEEIASLRDSGMHTAILPVGATEQPPLDHDYFATI
jgi:hypothetical protein